jgi:hypothetical protein
MTTRLSELIASAVTRRTAQAPAPLGMQNLLCSLTHLANQLIQRR